MNKYKYLLKNIGLLTISNFGTKILSFILIPIYTSILSTADYGTYDIYSTTVSLLVPLLTFNIIEAVMRFSLDEKYNRSNIFSIGINRIVLATAIVIVLVISNTLLKIVGIFTIYPLYFILLFAFSLLYDLLIQFSRGVERIADVAIAGSINSVIMLGLNVYFLAYLKIGLDGYFIANIFACVVPSLFLAIRLRVWKYYMITHNKELEHDMYAYSKPLIFNTIAWWVNNVSDRYIVTWLCGVDANGIYSVAYKIPSVLNIFQSIFSQAWTISAVKEFDQNSSSFYCNIYKAYNCGMVLVCSVLILADKIMARILFAKDFFAAWEYAPFLMVSVVFGALSGLLGGIFSAAKKSKVFATTTLIGAGINILLNVILVNFFGPVGAAISTLVSYLIVWSARLKEANKILHLNIPLRRDSISYLILIIQCILWLVVKQSYICYVCHTILVLMIIVLYYNDFIGILEKKIDNRTK